MPFITAPSPRGGRSTPGTSTVFPFELKSLTIDINNNPDRHWGKDDIDCGCPCSILSTNNQYTSSKSFYPLPAENENPTGQPENKLAVRVATNSFLFKGLMPPMESVDMMSDSRPLTKNDSIIKIYGLGYPIIIDSFLPQPETTETLKIWLTCCYSSRETEIEGTSFGAPCQAAITDTYAREILEPSYEKSTPQICYISAGTKFPEKLGITKIVNRSSIPNRPLIDRRMVEVHIPIGEVTKEGKVRAQYLRSNLWLADMCINGIPAKFPMSAYSEGPLY